MKVVFNFLFATLLHLAFPFLFFFPPQKNGMLIIITIKSYPQLKIKRKNST